MWGLPLRVPKRSDTPRGGWLRMDILLAGVGGQGILFITSLLAHAASKRGWPVIASETHGMAQRGGTVVSHLRLGRTSVGPLVPLGKADLLLGLNEDEGLRHLGYLKKGGSLLVEEGSGKLSLPSVKTYIAMMKLRAESIPAGRRAKEISYPLGANLILVGRAASLGWLPFSQRELERALRELSRPNLLEKNITSLLFGLSYFEMRASTGSCKPSSQS